VRRARSPAKGFYSLPGGRVEYGESLHTALTREVDEETGLKIEILGLAGWREVLPTAAGGGHYVILSFAARWSAGEVTLETSSGVFRAARCVVTLPLGVLQRVNRDGGVRLEPEPVAITHARRLAMGSAERFTMIFREPWWERSKRVDAKALRTLSFLFTFRRLPPVWWTPHPEPQALPTLTGWAGGPRAAKLIGRDADELGAQACAELAEVFGLPAQQVRNALLTTHKHDWELDPFACGAYSYVPAGALDAPAAMAEPEAGTLFFAGEHTDTTANWGTVHAALGTGLRVAQQVFSSFTSER